jgi:hypothetical protein
LDKSKCSCGELAGELAEDLEAVVVQPMRLILHYLYLPVKCIISISVAVVETVTEVV